MAQRGRLANLGWAAGLVAIALAIALIEVTHSYHFLWQLPLATLVPALVVAWAWPSMTRRVVPAALITLGLFGFVVIDNPSHWQLSAGGMYQFLSVGMHSVQSLLVLLVVAYVLLVLGGWLAWRTTDRSSELGHLVFGRLAEPERPRQLWAFLLVPVVLMAGELFFSSAWFRGGPLGVVLSIAALLGTHWLVTRRPELAARVAVLGLIVVGIAGAAAAVLTARSGARSSGAMAVSPGSRPAPVSRFQPQPRLVIDGLVTLDAGNGAGKNISNPLALLQGLAFAGFGLALTPVAFPGVRRFVGMSTDGELTRRVQRLTESRAVVVDTAAADLRRLERDLHDGAQARLVALGMNLRAAEKLIPVSPEAAVALVAEARETSARALTELRELVRGVHPPVLADRGLGDALRALALDTPMKIRAEIDLPDRLPAPIETACYFAVAEVLTNAVKHSGARHGQVWASHRDDVLRITVTDFGVGGADPARGTGLAGVERRLAAFDGIVAVNSPVGGPTMVVMEVPCASSSPRTSSC
jgi:signal transduction histidine kinase